MKTLLISASAGISAFESPAAEYAQKELQLNDILIDRPSSTFFARASGRSMEHVGIFDRDLLIIDRAAAKGRLDVVVAVLNGQLVCKQLDRKAGLLISSNSTYALTPADDFIEEGIVIRSVRLFREPAALEVALH